MKRHESSPDRQTVKFALGRTGSNKYSIEIASFLNTLKKKRTSSFVFVEKNYLLTKFVNAQYVERRTLDTL